MTVDSKDEIKLERPLNEVWEQAQALLRKKLTAPAFNSWIQPLQLQKLEDTEAVVVAVNNFGREWIINNKISPDICWALSEVLGYEVTLRIIVDPTISQTQEYTPSIASIAVMPQRQAAPEPSYDAAAQAHRNQTANLNPKYTLDAFVVGSHNQFCYSAAMAVADRPGQTYNPLFIYGGVGLGKTHLMQAIGHHVLVNNPRMVVRYVTCERFTNDCINSIQSHSMIDFRRRYRQVDVLLIDDIHFIEGKETMSEEFFHTFNTLRESGKQIVLSSDRAPKDIPKLEDRLRSRFEWGLIADMQPPDWETRVAILRKKSMAERMAIPDEVIEYIATSFKSNIRELEGALLRVHAYASLTGMNLNLSTAANVLQIGTPVTNKATITIENILGAVAQYYRVDTSDLRSAKRSKDLALPRHVAMYMAHEILKLSHSRIGECFGNRKHSSVIYAIDKIKDDLTQNPQLAHSIQQIQRQLGV